MVVDTEWDKQVWEEAWEPRAKPIVAEDSLSETGKAKRGSNDGRAAKRVKREEQRVVWGEEAQEEDNAMKELLMGQSDVPVNNTAQARLKVYSGMEWVMNEGAGKGMYPQISRASHTNRGRNIMGRVGEYRECDKRVREDRQRGEAALESIGDII